MTSFQISKGSDCRRSQHGLIQIHEFERRIIVRINNKGGDVPCIKCRAVSNWGMLFRPVARKNVPIMIDAEKFVLLCA